MGDLISRKALLEFASNHKNKKVDMNDIARFPAAFDVGMVVAELEEEHIDIVTEGDPTAIHHWNGAIEKAIEIVKGGGQGE